MINVIYRVGDENRRLPRAVYDVAKAGEAPPSRISVDISEYT